MTDEFESRVDEVPVYWKNSRCIRVTTVNEDVLFRCWHMGFVYRVKKDQWDSGILTEVH